MHCYAQRGSNVIKKYKKNFPENPYAKYDAEIKGLGDVVEKVAKPIAKVIDAVAGTKIQNCGGCNKRRKYLNKKFPLK